MSSHDGSRDNRDEDRPKRSVVVPRPPWDENGPFRTIALRTVTGVAMGATCGSVLAFLKSQPIGFYSLSMGVNFGIVSASFFTTREALSYAHAQRLAGARSPSGMSAADVLASPLGRSTLAGAIAGGILTTLHAGPLKGVVGAALWAGVAAVGQEGVDRVGAWRAAKAKQIRAERAALAGLDPRERDIVEGEQFKRNRSRFYSEPQLTGSVLEAGREAREAAERDGVSETGDKDPLAWMPSWSPIKKLDEAEHEATLRRRLDGIDELLRAGLRADTAAETAGQRRTDE